MTGGAYAVALTLPGAGFEVTAGEPVIGGLHGEDVRHHHCGHCLSWMFTRPGVGGLDIVNLRATLLDDATWFAPFVEMWTSEKLPFADTGAAHSFPADPDRSEFPRLVADYARHIAEAG